MIDPKNLLDQFLGQNAGGDLLAKGKQFANSKGGTLAIGAAAGGLLTVLLGSKKMRKLGGSALSYGGAAVLGGLAYKAWQEYQRQNSAAAAGSTQAKSLPPPSETAFDATVSAADGADFRIAVLRAMIAAAKADGHVDGPEQERIFARVEEQGLSADEKAFIFDELRRPLDIDAIAALASDEAQASQIWLASRLAIDPDDARERAYMDALAAKLKLPLALTQQLDAQVRAALPA